MSLTTRERGAYTRRRERGGVGGLIFGWAYIQVEKRVTNLGDLYSGELIHRGSYEILRKLYYWTLVSTFIFQMQIIIIIIIICK